MAFSAVAATTVTTPLAAVLARLTARVEVAGILLMGTTGTESLTPTSDYDLLLVLDLTAAPLSLVTTQIDGHLAEVYVTTVAALRRIAAATTPWPDARAEGAIARWVRTGRVVQDRLGALAEARAALVALPAAAPTEDDVYATWASVGYSRAHLRRYLASDDPATRETVDWRLLDGLAQVTTAYFTARRLPWRGEKEAIRYLMGADPDFLDRFRRCLAETDRERKVARFEELADLALAPVGGAWREGAVVVAPGVGFGAPGEAGPGGTVGEALAFWQGLVAADGQ